MCVWVELVLGVEVGIVVYSVRVVLWGWLEVIVAFLDAHGLVCYVYVHE